MVPVVINFGHHGSLFLIQVCTKSAFASFSTVGFPGSCICRDSRNLVNLFVITFNAVQSSDFLCNSFPWRHRSFTSVCLLQARIPPAPTNLLFQVFRTVFSVGKLHLGENLNIRTLAAAGTTLHVMWHHHLLLWLCYPKTSSWIPSTPLCFPSRHPDVSCRILGNTLMISRQSSQV